jgi:hypothetical protein
MALGQLPLFASAPRCRIKFNGIPVAYAVGLSVNVSLNIAEVKILGEFATQSLEPLTMAPVSGSLQIVRLISAATQAAQRVAADAVEGEMSGLARDPTTGALTQAKTNAQNSIINSGPGGAFNGQTVLARHLDPRTVLMSQAFDIEILLKVPVIEIDANGIAQPKAPNTITNPDTETAFMTIKNCRLVSGSANIAPGQLLTESVEFQGTLAVMEGRASRIEEANDPGYRDNVLGS